MAGCFGGGSGNCCSFSLANEKLVVWD
jgi:hypothetical protein